MVILDLMQHTYYCLKNLNQVIKTTSFKESIDKFTTNVLHKKRLVTHSVGLIEIQAG